MGAIFRVKKGGQRGQAGLDVLARQRAISRRAGRAAPAPRVLDIRLGVQAHGIGARELQSLRQDVREAGDGELFGQLGDVLAALLDGRLQILLQLIAAPVQHGDLLQRQIGHAAVGLLTRDLAHAHPGQTEHPDQEASVGELFVPRDLAQPRNRIDRRCAGQLQTVLVGNGSHHQSAAAIQQIGHQLAVARLEDVQGHERTRIKEEVRQRKQRCLRFPHRNQCTLALVGIHVAAARG
jgi:hypothetical protein